MEFVADPGILNVVRLLELVDNALADIAEGSDVIGKYSNVDAHLMLPWQDISEIRVPVLLFLPINIQPDLCPFMTVNGNIPFSRCNDNGLPRC